MVNIADLIQDRWYGGQLLAFSGLDGQTYYDTGIVATTSFHDPGIDIRLPASIHLNFALKHLQSLMASDYFEITGTDSDDQSQVIRGGFIDAHHLLIVGPLPQQQIELPDSVIYLQTNDRFLIGVKSHWQPNLINTSMDQIRQQRLAWFEHQQKPDESNELRRRTLARALCVMKTQVLSPEGKIRFRWTTPDRWPHRAMWLWDSAFHAIGWRHLDPQLAMEMIHAVLCQQQPDGFIAHMATPKWHSSITQPPVLCLAASMLQGLGADTQWYEQIYPALSAYVKWDWANRDTDGDGLVEWYIEQDDHCRSGESGMDNSTRFDSAAQLGAVDFNSFLALECELLGQMAGKLGYQGDAQRWNEHSQRLSALIREKLYDDQTGFFHDMDTARGQRSHVMASSGFLPLICQAAQAQHINSLLAHLQNPQTFGTLFPVPSIASQNAEHSTDMWRGPTWICINWLIAYGLDRHGYHDHARAIRRRSVEEIELWFDRHGTFFEYYDDRGKLSPFELMRKGKCVSPDHPDPYPHQVIRDYGWTATLYVDMVLSGEI